MSAQEAALDAFGLPLIMFSRKVVYLQAREPEETLLRLKTNRSRDNSNPNDLFYDPPVLKYIKRKYILVFILFYQNRTASRYNYRW